MKKVTNPAIIVDFVEAIMDKTTEEYIIEGWFSWLNKTDVRRKSFDQAEVEKIIVKEINQVRRDAVRAVYNCAIRDRTILTEKRMKRISACLGSEDEKCENSTFRSHIFKLVELAESREDFDYAEVFQGFIRQLSNGSVKNIEAILKFLNNQAKDLERSQELFRDDVILTLIGLLGSESALGSLHKNDVMDVINTYLEHENTQRLERGER